MPSVRETVAGVLKKAGGEIPSGFSKCGPIPLTDRADLQALRDDSAATYASVFHGEAPLKHHSRNSYPISAVRVCHIDR